MRIPIYEAEAKIEGLADKVVANDKSKAYHCELEVWEPSEAFLAKASKLGLARASHMDDDLFCTKSILATTNWNLNDDVFDVAETWMARHTPTHKPTNIEHDENRLVGHITDTWAIDTKGNTIPENTTIDNLPNPFHLANGAVIYTNFEGEGLIEQTEKLIAGIRSGEKFVSMEVLFCDFGYSIITPEDECHIVARGSDTAYLTKHLRAYGGVGEYEGCKIGRVLKNMTFCGKGYVDKPANPESIIFNSQTNFSFASASIDNPFKRNNGVQISYSQAFSSDSNDSETTETQMSDTNIDFLKKENDKLEAAVASLTVKFEEAAKANTEAGIQKLKDELEVSKTAVASSEEAVTEMKTKLAEAEAKASELAEAKEAVDAELVAANEEIATAKSETLTASRISTLVDGGVEKEVATEKVALYSSLDDAQFTSIATDIIAVAAGNPFAKDGDDDKDDKKKDDKKKDKKDAKASLESDDNEDNADEDDLENAEASANDGSASPDSEDEAHDALIGDLSVAFASAMKIELPAKN